MKWPGRCEIDNSACALQVSALFYQHEEAAAFTINRDVVRFRFLSDPLKRTFARGEGGGLGVRVPRSQMRGSACMRYVDDVHAGGNLQ